MSSETFIAPDGESLARAAAARFAVAVRAAVAARGSAAVALAGGTTPRRLYELLASPAEREGIPWSELHFFWGDERSVPAEDVRSNYRMAREALLAHVPVRPEHVHRMPADDPDLEAAARAYAEVLAAHAPAGAGGWPRLDLALLGLGSDGHTASLFPGDPALRENRRAVVAVAAAPDGTRRLSLTLPVLNAAALAIFLVAGADKANAVRRVLVERDPRLPATRVRPVAGRLIWLLDAAAAGTATRNR